MKIDQYINELVKVRQAHGPDLDVVNSSGCKAPLPRIGNRHLEQRVQLFKEGCDPDRYKGQKVVRV